MTPSTRGPRPGSKGSRPQSSRPPRSSAAQPARLPEQVYRRRRIAVGVAALVIVGLLALGIYGISEALNRRSQATPTAAEATQTQQAQAPGPSGDAASGKCPPEAISVVAEVDKQKFPEDKKPRLAIAVTNNHNASCLINVGTKHQVFELRKDDKLVWSSEYCADPKAGGDNEEADVVFAAGAQKRGYFQWDRVTVDKNCNRTAPTAPAGVYELTVKLDKAESKPVTFELEKPKETETPEPSPSS